MLHTRKPEHKPGFTFTEMLMSSMIMLLAALLITQTYTIVLYNTRARNWESEAQVWCNYISDSIQKKLLRVQKIRLLPDETAFNENSSGNAPNENSSGNAPDENVSGIPSDESSSGTMSGENASGIPSDENSSGSVPDESVSENTPDENASGIPSDENSSGSDFDENVSENVPDESVSGNRYGIDLLYLYGEPGGISPDAIFSGDITRDFGQFGTAGAEIEISYVENPVGNLSETSADNFAGSEKLLKVEVTVTDPSGIGEQRVNLFYVRPYHSDFTVS